MVSDDDVVETRENTEVIVLNLELHETWETSTLSRSM